MSDLVTPKGNLLIHMTVNQAKNAIVNSITSIPNYSALKNDLSLLTHVSNQVENMIPAKIKKAINKQDVVTDIMSTVFSISDQEKTIMNSNLGFLNDNNHIKAASTIKVIKNSVTGWVKKKLL